MSAREWSVFQLFGDVVSLQTATQRPIRNQSTSPSGEHKIHGDLLPRQTATAPNYLEKSSTSSVSGSGSGVPGAIAERALRQVGGLVFKLQPRPGGEFSYRGPVSADQQAPSDVENEDEADSDFSSISWPSIDELGQHLDMFLEWQSTCILILPKPVIDKICNDYESIQVQRTRNTVLVMAILSLTYMMYPNTQVDAHGSENPSHKFFVEAKKLAFDMALRNPCVQVVQATCILSCREYSRGNENAAWVLHGEHLDE